MFTFEDIATRLSGKDVSAVIRDVPEDELLKALKYGEAAGSPSVAFVIENLPKRLGERFVEDMAALEAVSAKDGEAAQLTLSKAVQAQVRSGAITLIDKDEEEG
jgi:flagellar motor switch protein FliG